MSVSLICIVTTGDYTWEILATMPFWNNINIWNPWFKMFGCKLKQTSRSGWPEGQRLKTNQLKFPHRKEEEGLTNKTQCELMHRSHLNLCSFNLHKYAGLTPTQPSWQAPFSKPTRSHDENVSRNLNTGMTTRWRCLTRDPHVTSPSTIIYELMALKSRVH